MILVMVGSTVSKHSRRSDVGMGSSSHDLGAHLVTTECKQSRGYWLKEGEWKAGEWSMMEFNIMVIR